MELSGLPKRSPRNSTLTEESESSRVYARPLADETSQIHAFMDTVVPIVGRKEAPKRT